mmetsp:Transcript_92522/g.245761  ORF Transcript_92522/g.245761 Transcript_92522/m.245761 type:complete len:244 (-) Transcript_92522:116-847(-)|eukprot:CAMPEP_0171201396 /NCGR_PEP_ID=MMETSP0790-20130122/24468_1 /TAXON_ID=2925 /ORGANISM="Alexandrium catenella, Strain OF101" /LENGTH=243 /DNA_ID=CAMNT_0011666793 /DNA_START=115 /DNA_END=846 /DNA_ORIENTATION=+
MCTLHGSAAGGASAKLRPLEPGEAPEGLARLQAAARHARRGGAGVHEELEHLVAAVDPEDEAGEARGEEGRHDGQQRGERVGGSFVPPLSLAEDVAVQHLALLARVLRVEPPRHGPVLQGEAAGDGSVTLLARLGNACAVALLQLLLLRLLATAADTEDGAIVREADAPDGHGLVLGSVGYLPPVLEEVPARVEGAAGRPPLDARKGGRLQDILLDVLPHPLRDGERARRVEGVCCHSVRLRW